MKHITIDMDNNPRKAHFEYFNAMASPYIGLTAQTDITLLYDTVKAEKLPMFLSMLYAVTVAANSVPELRRRVADGSVIEYERCRPSFTLALDNDTYCYCTVNAPAQDLHSFIAEGKREQELAKVAQNLSDGEDDGDLLFISCLPWMNYSGFVQPTPSPADYNPRITWGKIYEQNGCMLMPLTLLANHALVDGLHVSRFYEAFERCLSETFSR